MKFLVFWFDLTFSWPYIMLQFSIAAASRLLSVTTFRLWRLIETLKYGFNTICAWLSRVGAFLAELFLRQWLRPISEPLSKPKKQRNPLGTRAINCCYNVLSQFFLLSTKETRSTLVSRRVIGWTSHFRNMSWQLSSPCKKTNVSVGSVTWTRKTRKNKGHHSTEGVEFSSPQSIVTNGRREMWTFYLAFRAQLPWQEIRESALSTERYIRSHSLRSLGQ